MAALTFTPGPEKVRTRDGRQYLKDSEYCDGIKVALKTTLDNKSYLSTQVVGKSELRKLRGALRHFAEEAGSGLSVKTDGDEKNADDKTVFTVTFRAQPKRDVPKNAAPRKVRRRKDETEKDYAARLRVQFPRTKGETEAKWDARIAAVYSPASK